MLQGEIRILPLADLVQWLALNQRTGSLKVTRDNYSIELFFAKGEVAAASASNHPVLDNPEKVIGAFKAVLKWPVGRRATDGVWAPFWYAEVEKSTEFRPFRPKSDPLPDELQELYSECIQHYEQLHAYRLT
jgi:hypothetical protein